MTVVKHNDSQQTYIGFEKTKKKKQKKKKTTKNKY